MWELYPDCSVGTNRSNRVFLSPHIGQLDTCSSIWCLLAVYATNLGPSVLLWISVVRASGFNPLFLHLWLGLHKKVSWFCDISQERALSSFIPDTNTPDSCGLASPTMAKYWTDLDYLRRQEWRITGSARQKLTRFHSKTINVEQKT